MHNAHLQQTHKRYAPRCCFHSQAYSISPLLAITIHLKPPPIVHTTHLPALPKPYIGLKERWPELLFSGRLLNQVISCQGPVAAEKKMWANPKKQHTANHVPIIQRETAEKRVLENNSLYGS